jgi:biopolymer transport protein ExbD
MRIPATKLYGGMAATVTPLVDVAFQLLIFFLCTASFAMSELALPATLPDSQAKPYTSAREIQELELVSVSLSQEATRLRIMLNGSPVASIAELRDRLMQLRALASLPAVLHIEPDVNLAQIIDVYNACLLAGVHEIRLVIPER